MKCDCISYNQPQDWQKTPEVVMPCPEHLRENVSAHKAERGICIDACIVDQIKQLWASRIITKSSCCGHNKVWPSVVVEECHAMLAKSMLTRIDPARRWQVLYWHQELREYGSRGSRRRYRAVRVIGGAL